MKDDIDLKDLTGQEREMVKKFIDSLKEVRPKTEHRGFNFSWAGGLKGVFKGISSVDLQHKSLGWR